MLRYLNTYLSNTIELTDKKAHYDNCAKAIMADKQVLARIAKHTTKEFKDYDIPTIILCIEGDPEISTIPVYPGMRKKSSEAIDGMKEESTIPNEGTITFDIRFNMVTLDEVQIKIILNIELQNDYYESYHFEPRAVFYCARMISEQLNREFSADDYDNLKKYIPSGFSLIHLKKTVTRLRNILSKRKIPTVTLSKDGITTISP